MNLEQDVREMLRARAAAFAPALQPSESVLRRARLRTLRSLLTTTLLIVSALLGAVTIAGSVTREQRAFAAVNVRDTRHLDGGARPSHEHARPGEPITGAMLVRNVRCMRDQGFNLPDPVKTAEGWQVIVENSEPLPSESPDLSLRKRWARAVFVDCRLMDVTDDLVLGGRTRQQIDGLMACARAKGFVLPNPTESTPGEFVFDLDAASPPWGTVAWYETIFVACGLWRLGPPARSS